ncbi:hypothetical protein CWI37_2366p0010 [Hamiltosporidium tvaerminnensis]|uniref:Secreted protein n=1 Tax=Hamiltosporidium tvaerminnensis TaxID=1176355 RepID=A0A4Q9KRI2_9MICR|nr:hypothetical protein CWI37_2366p0010 [Hamiltosporidium tvaerminnensis]
MGLIVYLGVFMSVLCIPCEAVVTQALRTPVAINSTDSQVYEPDPLSEPSKEKRKGMFGRTVRTVRDFYKDTIQHLQNSGGKWETQLTTQPTEIKILLRKWVVVSKGDTKKPKPVFLTE